MKHSEIPPYRLHKGTGVAYVLLNGHRTYLGKHGTPESQAAYQRTIAEWLANHRRLSVPQAELTIAELARDFLKYAEGFYAKRREPEKTLSRVRTALAPLSELYADTPAVRFTPKSLLAIRERYIAKGLSRRTINELVQIVQRTFRWATVQELIPGSVSHALNAVRGLRAGESEAPEPKEITPVPDEHVDAIRGHVSGQVWAMIELQRLTGMRPGETVIMRGADLDMSGSVWVYRPTQHKNLHRGKKREVCLGPKAQEIVKSFLRSNVEEYLFSPRDAERSRYAACKVHRHQPTEPAESERKLRDRYGVGSYATAIRRACLAAKLSVWSPHRLRHSFATRIARMHGTEIARAMLGHASVCTSELYIERDRAASATVALKIG